MVATQSHCTVGAFRGRMARPRRCRRAVWISPLLNSRALESRRVSSQADAGLQAQLRRRVQARFPSSLPSCKEASKASAQLEQNAGSRRAVPQQWCSCCPG
jgi:hypothetical protein